jgi:hypothetical protein
MSPRILFRSGTWCSIQFADFPLQLHGSQWGDGLEDRTGGVTLGNKGRSVPVAVGGPFLALRADGTVSRIPQSNKGGLVHLWAGCLYCMLRGMRWSRRWIAKQNS